VVIEHNLDVIACSDWVIDLGPDGGERGGRLVAEGTPEQVAAEPGSFTGQYLREILGSGGSAAAAIKRKKPVPPPARASRPSARR
jgi:excinuclease ABC subunit A